MPTTTVREFIYAGYKLVSPDAPTVANNQSEFSFGLRILNAMLSSYATSGLLQPIAATQSAAILAGTSEIIVGAADYVPTPDITAGRIANLMEAWVETDGVIYPLQIMPNQNFLNTYKYDPLQSVPLFIMNFEETDISRLRIYPAASQAYTFYVRAKFQLGNLTKDSTMALIPDYMELFLMYAFARQIAKFKGRNEAWTPDLESMYLELKQGIIGASEVAVAITGPTDVMLNGAAQVRAGLV